MQIRTLRLLRCAAFLAAVVCLAPSLSAQVSLSTVSPGSAEPGLTTVTLTGSGFPSGTILPANISITLAPGTIGAGPTIAVPASAIASVLGSIRRVSFLAPASLIVAVPTPYAISLADSTDSFSSTNTVPITINPGAVISAVTPNSGTQGQTVPVTVNGQYSNFLQGLTTVSAGTGIAVSNVAVLSPTSLTATFTIGGNATLGSRPVTAASGGETALLSNAFTVNAGQALITGITPASAQQGQTLNIAFTGTATNFAAGTTTATLGTGLTVNSVTVANSTHATVNATVNPVRSTCYCTGRDCQCGRKMRVVAYRHIAR